MVRALSLLSAMALRAACGGAGNGDEAPGNGGDSNAVSTTGKVGTDLSQVPPEVLAAAKAAQPEMEFTEAEAEVRDGRNYYDVAGTLPDGSEIELDMLQEPGGWRVVETQRDIAFSAVPEPVRAATVKADAAFVPVRVIESRQSDDLVIYELFGPPENGAEGRKVEIKWDGKSAELLTKEWAH